MLLEENNRLIFRYDAEKMIIEPWGENSLRIRATKEAAFPEEDWALINKGSQSPEIVIGDREASISNGKIRATVSAAGKVQIYNQHGKVLLEEYVRNRRDVCSPDCSALEIEAREFKGNTGGDYHLTFRMVSQDPEERLYGMGQYQQPYLNLKGLDMELAHRNSQSSVPFMLSSLGYGFLWNNPAVGRAVLGKNIMSFEAYSTKALDYWITAGDTPAEIEETYASVTGTVPMMPEYGLGFWQCKLRYQTQEELLKVAREYHRRGIPLDVIVIDFFHWPKQGEWRFDPVYWPDPQAMVDELHSMGIELMVSVWPTVDQKSENYDYMMEHGYLIRTERGYRLSMDFEGNTIHCDMTNPEARKYLWSKLSQNYGRYGIRTFWLDEAEPEYSVYDFDNYRYWLGSNLQIGNIYPRCYAQAVYEGQSAGGEKNFVNLLRCAWAGSQKYGALVWSGDIASTFRSMRNQLAAGLSMGLAGIPWWTSDIGGFHGGNPKDEKFRELLVRWFQWGTFCPVMRLHGDREPKQPQVGTTGGATCLSGADNEVWSFGDRAYEICKKYIGIREKLRPYIRGLMEKAHENGTPLMRPMFYDCPEDPIAWKIEDAYFFGPDILVAPVMSAGCEEREVYLPAGSWQLYGTGEVYAGKQWLHVRTPLEEMPFFCRENSTASACLRSSDTAR